MNQRTKMLVEYSEGGYSVAALARRYGVSRKSAYKWIERFETESWEGLKERSRAPHHQAQAIEEKVVGRILELKAQWPLWGAPKVHFTLGQEFGVECSPSESTVSNVLHRHGLTKAPKRRHRISEAVAASYGHHPNEVWCADFKGWWLLANGMRCTPLTITDVNSRYLIRCHALGESTRTDVVRAVFTAAFREFGLPEAMRTDNGTPFATHGLQGLSALSVWWLKLGIKLDRIKPGHPEQNGRHERMHRTLKEHMGQAARHLRGQQEQLQKFLHHYNHERPHEALSFAVPAACYRPSQREWSEKVPAAMEYPQEWETRMVRKSGQMKWGGRNVRVTNALRDERIGLQPVGDGVWQVWFGSYELGIFDERKGRVAVARRARTKTESAAPHEAPATAGQGPCESSLRSS